MGAAFEGEAMQTEIGYKIKAFRKKKGFSQNDMASFLKTSIANISRWERNINYPSKLAVLLLKDMGVLKNGD